MSAAELATPVSPGLYVGPYLYAKSLGWVKRHGVTHIVNVTPWAPCVHAHITYLHIPIEDAANAPIAEHFDRCHAFISAAHASGGVVLVHCQMGRSRSVTLTAAHLMAKRGIGWREALSCVRVGARRGSPNTGFLRALKSYEATLQAASEHAAQCSCKEMAALRGLRTLSCSVCSTDDDDDTTELPPQPPADLQELGLHRERYAALAELLDADPALEEIGFVPGPLHAGLFEGADAADRVTVAPLPPLEVGMISASHRLAIDISALPALFAETSAAWKEARRVAGGDREGPAPRGAALERATRCILLLSLGQNYTAWADRKRLLIQRRPPAAAAIGDNIDSHRCNGNTAQGGRDDGDAWRVSLERELAFSALVLRSFSKAHEAFAHRRWVLAECERPESGLGLSWFLETHAAREQVLCQAAMAKRKSNYHAARHLAEACTRRIGEAPSSLSSAATLRSELQRSRAAAARAPSDPSVFHVRRAALDAAQRLVRGPKTRLGLLLDEVSWVEAQILRAPWQEVLRTHRRWLMCRLQWDMAPSTADPTSGLADRDMTPAQRAAAERGALLDAAWCTQVLGMVLGADAASGDFDGGCREDA